MLPPIENFDQLLSDYFIFYRPKDIVSGDFYWIEEVNDLILFGVIDCTGHGVPGALMSVIGMNLLNQAIKEKGITNPAEILNALDAGVYKSLRQYSDGAAKDGMDLSICCFNKKTFELAYAGAFNPCWIVSKADTVYELNEIKADMKSIGLSMGMHHAGYNVKNIKLKKGDSIYLFSDGFSDQFGGPLGKKFKTSRFRELFTGMQNLPMKNQKEHIQKTFEEWKMEFDQIDDVCVMGVRI
jgi:serine phosphatase RsbU (regulator of sigma subunit)